MKHPNAPRGQKKKRVLYVTRSGARKHHQAQTVNITTYRSKICYECVAMSLQQEENQIRVTYLHAERDQTLSCHIKNENSFHTKKVAQLLATIKPSYDITSSKTRRKLIKAENRCIVIDKTYNNGMFQRKSNKLHIHCFGKFLPTPLKSLRETFYIYFIYLYKRTLKHYTKSTILCVCIYICTEAEFGIKTVHHLFSTCGALQSYDILILPWHIRVRTEN